jgi:hypothetical protein
MKITMDLLPLKLVAIRRPQFISLLVLTLLMSLFCLPIAGFTAQDSQVVNELKQKAQHAYDRLDKRQQSYLAFKAIASHNGEKKLSSSDGVAYKEASRHLQMSWTWAWVAWAVIVMLWAAVLLMRPWQRLTRASIRKFLLWPVLWIVLTAAAMPTFYSLETTGYPIVIPDTAVYIAAGLNLIILFWLLLLPRGKFWQTRPLALRWLSPALTLLMTISVIYLFVIYQPNGPEIIDVFAVKLHHWNGEWHLL